MSSGYRMRWPLREWLDEVRSLNVVHQGSTGTLGTSNALFFSMTSRPARSLTVASPTTFIEEAASVYRPKRPESASLWFYAWVDEQAAQLRMSAAACNTPQQRPVGRSDLMDPEAEVELQDLHISPLTVFVKKRAN